MSLISTTPPPLRRHELVAGQSNFLQAKRARSSYEQKVLGESISNNYIRIGVSIIKGSRVVLS